MQLHIGTSIIILAILLAEIAQSAIAHSAWCPYYLLLDTVTRRSLYSRLTAEILCVRLLVALILDKGRIYRRIQILTKPRRVYEHSTFILELWRPPREVESG